MAIVLQSWQIGTFVKTSDDVLGVVIGRCSECYLNLLLPCGDTLCWWLVLCRAVNPPSDPLCPPLNAYVLVNRGRLEGMFGRVIGSLAGVVFVRPMRESKLRHNKTISQHELLVFVENMFMLSQKIPNVKKRVARSRRVRKLPTIVEESEPKPAEHYELRKASGSRWNTTR